MKRVIRSSTRPVKAAIDPELYSDLENKARHCGYDLSVDSNGNISVTALDAEEKMPEITIRTIEGDRTSYDAHLKFQELDTANEQYYDAMLYYIHNWEKAAEFVTYLVQWSPDDYIDEE